MQFTEDAPINAENIKNVPEDSWGVYRINCHCGKTVFVGKGRNLPQGIRDHNGEGGHNFQYALNPANTKYAARRLEKKEIRNYKPKFHLCNHE